MWEDVKPDRKQMTDGVHMHVMLDKKEYRQVIRICNTFLFTGDNNVYANAPHPNVYTYITCLVAFFLLLCLFILLAIFISFIYFFFS